jgi:alkaline phosphatase D
MNDRRELLKSLAAAGGFALLPRALRAAAPARLPDYPFTLGVASGYPADRSVVLWTRLAPHADQPGGGMPPADFALRYEVSSDENFRRIVSRGEAVAEARFAHSVHQQVTGLDASRDYWYRFIVGDHVSATGRARTLPAAGARVDRLRMVVASCQNYEHGHYAAWRHATAEAPQLILFLGDYIYESNARSGVRRHAGGVPLTLDEYRQRYAQYKADPLLQAAHAVAPWFAVWDDHEVLNDYAGETPGRQEEHAVFMARRAAAYQAWYEHLPVPPSMAPEGGGMRIYTHAGLGGLATLHLLDQRQYRSPEACPKPPQLGGLRVFADCAERLDPARTMLGAEQERWLAAGLRRQQGAWTLIGQGTPFGQLDEAMGEQSEYWTDSWTGYPAARQRLLDALKDTRAANPVILGGDFHAFMVGSVNTVAERFDTPLLAAEFTGTSISSDALPQTVFERWLARNPNLQVLDGTRRGYLSLLLTPKQLRTDLVTIDDASRPDSGRAVAASRVVEAGNPAILPA